MRLFVGIVGHENEKFDAITEPLARTLIRDILTMSMESFPRVTVVSGRCPLGGVDIYAEEIAEELGLDTIIYPPKENGWEFGYKPRNIQIAQQSDILHNIVVRKLPDGYRGMRFPACYHCHTASHVKSGGCWTAKLAERLGKAVIWHEI